MSSENQQPTAAENFHKQAEIYLSQRKLDETIASCELAIKIEPGYAPPYKTLGNALQSQGKLEEAEKWYQKALAMKPQWPEVCANLGSIYAKQQDWQRAVELFKKAIAIKPDFAGAYRNLARVLELAGDHQQALEARYQALNLEPEKGTEEEYLKLGDAFQQKLDLTKAISCYRNAIKVNENSAKAYQRLGEALKKDGKLNEATVSYRRAVELNSVSSGDTLGDTLVASQKQIGVNNNNQVYAQDTLAASLSRDGGDTLAASTSTANSKGILGDTIGGVTVNNLGITTQDLEALTMLAEAYLTQKKWPEAIAASQQIIRHQANAKAYKIIGNAQQARGEIKEAIGSYAKALEIQPNFPEVCANLGSINAQQQQWQRAIAYYQKAISLKPDFVGAYRNLAKIFRAINKQKEEAECLYEAMRREPDMATEAEYLAVGNVLLKNSKLEAALACYRAAIHLNPNSLQAVYQLGEIFNSSGQLDKAISFYQKAAAINPEYQDVKQKLESLESQFLPPAKPETDEGKVYYLKGEELEKEGKKEEAIAAYRQAVELKTEVDVVYQKLGEILVEKEEWEEAVNVNRKATELSPDFSWSHNNLGNALKALEKWEEAAAAYRQAVELNPNFEWSQISLADCLMKLEKWEEVVPVYRRAIELKPDFVWSYVNLGKAFWNLGEWQKAIAPYQQALTLKKDIPEIYQHLGEALHKRARLDLDEALEWYRAAIEANPDNIDLYHKALDIAPEDDTLYLQLGEALVKQGKGYLAVGFYQVGLQINPDSSEIKAALAKLKSGGTSGAKKSSETGFIEPKKESSETGFIESKKESSETEFIEPKKESSETQFLGETGFLAPQKSSETGFLEPKKESKDIYQLWLKANLPKQAKLDQMRDILETFREKPLIAVVMPVGGDATQESLRESIESVGPQVYPNWELWCMADNVTPKVRSLLEEYTRINNKIKLLPNPEPGNFAAGINAALSLASGEFFGLLGVGDTLTRDALYQMAILLNRHPRADLIYADEDERTASGELTRPYFKPDWSPESLMSRYYIGRFSLYRRDLVVSELMGLRVGFEGSEEYDLVLRLSEKTDKIYHISKVLYHRQESGLETGPETRFLKASWESGKKALEEAIARRGQAGRVEVVDNHPGFYRVRYEIEDYKRVSIIIPTRNLGDILDRCLESIFEKTTYPNYEVIVVDNGSDEPATKEIFQKWEGLEPQRFQCLELDIPFNFAKLNNFAVEKAAGDYILFLNNDTEVITPDWLEGMVEMAQREAIGAVGPLLLYPDNTIQHAGVAIGLRSVADHSHRGFKSTDAGYHGQIISVNNYSAVTAACLMCRREVFEAVGGFDEGLAVAFNDVDFCLKISHKGYRNVYLPHVSLYHHESKSRGVEDTGEKQRRFQQELQTMKQRWWSVIEEDPYYNIHLSREKDDFSLRVVTDVEANVSWYERDAEIVGFAIDTPKPGVYKNVSSISIGGWVLGKKYPVTTVKLSCEGKLLRDVPANLPRQDVGQANPEFPHAQHCGFWGEMETIEFPPDANVLVEAVLKDGSHVRLGMVKLRCPELV